MIRPRGGDFVYSDLEVSIMLEDLKKAREAGSQGLVYGLLTKENELDKANLERLLAASQGLEVVFHMAFDAIPKDKQFAALDWLAEHGVKRILTHGGSASETIQEHFGWLKELVDYAGDRIEILPGGGITTKNRNEIVEKLGVSQLHGTKVVF